MNKRILSLILVLVLMLSMTTTAFAASTQSTIETYEGLIEISNVTSEGNPWDDEHFSMDKIEEILGGFSDDAKSWDDEYRLYFAEAPVTITMKKAQTYGIQWYSYYYEDDLEPKANITKYDTQVYDYDVMDEYVTVKASQGTITVEKPGVYYFYFFNGHPASSEMDVGIYLVVEGNSPANQTTPTQPKPNATPTSSTVLVNKAPINFEAYTIEGNNYFKLRDLAQVLNQTPKNFEVTWDGTNNAINLISNTPYTPAGGELAKGDSTAKNATPTTSKIYKDGVEVKLTAYTINNNNFFKLRDIAEAFNIGVTWDGTTNTVGIDTSIGYTAE